MLANFESMCWNVEDGDVMIGLALQVAVQDRAVLMSLWWTKQFTQCNVHSPQSAASNAEQERKHKITQDKR